MAYIYTAVICKIEYLYIYVFLICTNNFYRYILIIFIKIDTL